SLQVPLPSLREQEEIVRLLSALDWKIQAEEIRVQALDGLFKTVLHLLMTGRVRVKDLPRSEIEGVSPGASREWTERGEEPPHPLRRRGRLDVPITRGGPAPAARGVWDSAARDPGPPAPAV